MNVTILTVRGRPAFTAPPSFPSFSASIRAHFPSVKVIDPRSNVDSKNAISIAARSRGSRVVARQSRSIFDLVRDFMKDEAFNQQDGIFRRYVNPALLILDDSGLKQLLKNSGEHLFEMIMRRCENRSATMTSNRSLEERGKLLDDVPTAGAILDRFLHHAQTISRTVDRRKTEETIDEVVREVREFANTPTY